MSDKIKKPQLKIFHDKKLGPYTIEGVYEKQSSDDKKSIKNNELSDKTCPGESCNGDCGCDEDCWYY